MKESNEINETKYSDAFIAEQGLDYENLLFQMLEIRRHVDRVVEGKKRMSAALADRWTAIHVDLQATLEGKPHLFAEFRSYIAELSAMYEGIVRENQFLNAVRDKAGFQQDWKRREQDAAFMLRTFLQQIVTNDPYLLVQRVEYFLDITKRADGADTSADTNGQ